MSQGYSNLSDMDLCSWLISLDWMWHLNLSASTLRRPLPLLSVILYSSMPSRSIKKAPSSDGFTSNFPENMAANMGSGSLVNVWRLVVKRRPPTLRFMVLRHGVDCFLHKRLNTGMAPTCDWMIKIVKVNKLCLNSLLVSIVNRVSQSGTMKYQCEWKHRCVKQEMVTYVAKGRQPFLFSEVVQRHSGDEKVICWLNSFSQFRRTTRDWSHSCISPLTGIAPTQTFINFFSIIS